MPTVQDQVRSYLQERANGSNYIAIGSMDDFIAPSKISKERFLGAFYHLMQKGEIETEKVPNVKSGKIKGITLKKMPSATTIVHNTAQKALANHKSKPMQIRPEKRLEHTSEYMSKKRVLSEVATKLQEAGFDLEQTIHFTPDPIAEEAISLLDLVERAQTAINELTEERDQLKIKLSAEQEITKRYEQRLKLTPETLAASNAEEPNANKGI